MAARTRAKIQKLKLVRSVVEVFSTAFVVLILAPHDDGSCHSRRRDSLFRQMNPPQQISKMFIIPQVIERRINFH